MTALMYSVHNSSTSTFKILLKHKAKVSSKDKKTLIKSTKNSSQNIISFIIESNTVKFRKKEMEGVLFNAAANNHTKIINALSKKGVNLNAKDKSGNTALIISASKGSYNACLLLIEYKVDINAKNKHGNTALIFASQTERHKNCYLVTKRKSRFINQK